MDKINLVYKMKKVKLLEEALECFQEIQGFHTKDESLKYIGGMTEEERKLYTLCINAIDSYKEKVCNEQAILQGEINVKSSNPNRNTKVH